jgi:hypothetical protein
MLGRTNVTGGARLMDIVNSRPFGSSIMLFERMGSILHGFSYQQVNEATLNVILKSLQQAHPTLAEAEQAWEQLTAGVKPHLKDCYEAAGRKKSYSYYPVGRDG